MAHTACATCHSKGDQPGVLSVGCASSRARVSVALRNTTETLARELAHPTESTPGWSPFEWQVAQAVCAMHGVSAVLSGKLRWQGPAHWTEFLRDQRAHTARRYERIKELLALIDA